MGAAVVENANNLICPSTSVLAAYASATLRPPEITAHLASCPRCQGRLQELSQDELLVGQLRDALDLQQQTDVRRALQAATVGDYEILETLGHGSYGIVYKARDLRLERLVAIKCLAARVAPERVNDMLQEARTLARVSHPGIAAVYAICPKPELPFIVMELVEGRPITEALRNAPLPEQLKVFTQVLQAVAELHRRGVVHRDLKPDNILVDGSGNVKLVDLGIAHAADLPGLDWANRAEGTPAYLSPEQSFGRPARPSADVFSLGVILFELLTQQRPFTGATEAQIIIAIRQMDPPLPRSLRQEIPGALQAICLTAMEKDPAHRYSSAGEFLLDLERFLRGEAIAANPTLLVSALDHGIERHITDLQRWRGDRLISTREYDYLLSRYDRLRQREEFWLLDSRRISFSQVLLHLGVWACVISAFLMLAFPWPHLRTSRLLLAWMLLPGMLYAGCHLWRKRTFRVASVLLIGAAILCPLALATGLVQYHVLEGTGAGELLPGIVGNRQLLVSTLGGMAMSLALWCYTRTAAFSLVSGLMTIAVATAVFGLLGLRAQLDAHRIDIVAGWYLGIGAALFGAGMIWDLQRRIRAFALPLYVIGLAVVLIALTLIAGLGPTPHWLGWAPLAQGEELMRQIQYSFAANGMLYLLSGIFANRSAQSALLRRIGTILFWLAPSHVLIPVLRLEDQWPLWGSTWTAPELLLPVGALAFIFLSVPRQMKSFFFSGLLYLAIAVQRMTARHFDNVFAWPVALAVTGVVLVLVAWRYPRLFDRDAAPNALAPQEPSPGR